MFSSTQSENLGLNFPWLFNDVENDLNQSFCIQTEIGVWNTDITKIMCCKVQNRQCLADA